MTIKEALYWGANKFRKRKNCLNNNLDSIFLDAEILLSKVIRKPKEFLYTYPEKKLTSLQIKKYKNFVQRRTKNEPVAYIVGKKKFYKQQFLVTPDVLIPRPETELLIDITKKTIGLPKPDSLNIIDVGTGSGAIAITLKKMFPRAQIFGTEVSSRALTLARKNAKHLNANITIKKANLLDVQGLALNIINLAKKSGNLIITANLPYLSEKEWRMAQPEVKKYEPKGALVGGKYGWELYEKLFKDLKDQLSDNKNKQHKQISLIIEIGAKQKTQITKLIKKYLNPKKIESFKDLNKKWRVIKCILRKVRK